MKQFFIGSALAVGLGTVLLAQATPPAAPAPAAPPPKPQSRPAATSSASALSVMVTDKSGNGIGDVNVALSGPVERSGRTAADGSVAFRSMRGGNLPAPLRTRTLHHARTGNRRRDAGLGRVRRAQPCAGDQAGGRRSGAGGAATGSEAESRRRAAHRFPCRTSSKRTSSGRSRRRRRCLAVRTAAPRESCRSRSRLTNQVNEDADQILYVVAGGGSMRVRDRELQGGAGIVRAGPARRADRRAARRQEPAHRLSVTMGAACTETTTPLAK